VLGSTKAKIRGDQIKIGLPRVAVGPWASETFKSQKDSNSRSFAGSEFREGERPGEQIKSVLRRQT
jgi:hypothetical protein